MGNMENRVRTAGAESVFVYSQDGRPVKLGEKALDLFKPRVFVRVGDKAPAKTVSKRTLELTPRQARKLAAVLLDHAEQIDPESN
jgi:hypothetical protein